MRFNSFLSAAIQEHWSRLVQHRPVILEVSVPHTETVPHCYGIMKAFYYDRKAKTVCWESFQL